ncbi:MAG: S1C family serine protease [Planctomycetota bacterium]
MRILAVPLILALAAAAQEPPTKPANDSSPAAASRPIHALAIQSDLIGIARKVQASVVTVRSFVRAPLDGEATNTAGVTTPPTAPPTRSTDSGDGDSTTGWIAAPTTEREYPGFRDNASGSGFFVGKPGDVMTSLQAIRTPSGKIADLIEIETMDGHRVLMDVVGFEPTLQFAILRCAVFQSWDRPAMLPLEFGASDDLEIGSLLIGCGDPYGPERFLAMGMLVAKPSRDCYQELQSASYMQATMTLHQGAYGGPLVDLDGRVVGILSRLEIDGAASIVSPQSAWALPSKILAGLYDSVTTAGTTKSPWLGFSVMSRTEIATTRGLQVFQKMKKPPHGILLENVFRPSPAESAGLLPDDFLTHFEGVEIHAPVDFQRQLYLAGVGRKITVRMFRAGEVFERELVVEARPEQAKPR